MLWILFSILRVERSGRVWAVPRAVQFDITVPAPADAGPADQYYAVFTDDFDGSYFLTPIDTAFFDDERCAANPQDCLIQTDPVEGYAASR